MNNEEFEEMLEKRLVKTQNVLGNKAKEYVQGGDRLYNFKRAAKIQHTTQSKALWGMATKHLVSVIDLVEGKEKPTDYMINEKIGDMINYLILLEAVFKEEKN